MVSEVALEPHNPRVAIQDPGIQGSQPRASVVVGQETPFTGSALFLIKHYHHYYYGCKHGGLGRSLLTARVDQRPLVEVRTLATELRAVRLMRFALCMSGRSPDHSSFRRFIDQVSTTCWQTVAQSTRPYSEHLTPLMAQRLFRMWGRPEVNLFASHQNHQLPLWFCRTDHPLAAASNALSQSWMGLSLYRVPTDFPK